MLFYIEIRIEQEQKKKIQQISFNQFHWFSARTEVT